MTKCTVEWSKAECCLVLSRELGQLRVAIDTPCLPGIASAIVCGIVILSLLRWVHCDRQHNPNTNTLDRALGGLPLIDCSVISFWTRLRRKTTSKKMERASERDIVRYDR